MTPASNDTAIGIDVGGTAIKGGLVALDGTIIERRSTPANANEGVDAMISRIAGLIMELQTHAHGVGRSIASVGIGVPGTIRHREGIVEAPPNLPGWINIPLVDRVQKLTSLRVHLENDANAAALGEFLCGAGQGVSDMVMLTLGTGVGGGIIADGKLFRGALENAGELGHMIVEPRGRRCGCGQLGCLEAYASASYTAARYREKLGANVDCAIDAENVVDAVKNGDPVAMEVWEETCFYLAIGCINIQHILNPQLIVFAGGMSAAGDLLLEPVRGQIAAQCSEKLGPKPVVGLAKLGNDAGLVGAALGSLP